MADNNERYVAYVSTYTSGSKDKFGIKIYDVDLEKGYLIEEKDHIEITNCSYMTASHDHRHLYAITDFGVQAHEILADGRLRVINEAPINGMRGCFLSTCYDNKYIFVTGYHDGKLTVLRINEDGSAGEIVDEIYHKGLGSVAERRFRPHINCARMTKDNKYLCEADLGMDRVNVYDFNKKTGKLKLVDVIRSEQDSAPRHLKFSRDGKYLYIIHALKNYIDIYQYNEKSPGIPDFEKIQTISTLSKYHDSNSAASTLRLSFDNDYLLASNAGDNSVILYSIDHLDGLIYKLFCLPISGDYPKDASFFPDNRHIVSLNHESSTMTFFEVDFEKKIMMMSGKEIKVDRPNCIFFHKLS